MDELRNRIVGQIKADLTTGRSDRDLKQYNDYQITTYINRYSMVIDYIVKDLIDDIIKDAFNNTGIFAGGIEDDCIREYLYKRLRSHIT